LLVPKRFALPKKFARFFAGFCLIANGAYIGLGSFGRIGDCGEMLRTGTPLWVMIAFGLLTIPHGLYLWHGLGSLKQFLQRPELITPRMAFGVAAVLAVVLVTECLLSPR
jgi:hypothetical protein